MKTFLNLKTEFPINHPDRDKYIETLLSIPLMRRITFRGYNEQYASVNYLHYDETIKKRKLRANHWKNNKFFFN